MVSARIAVQSSESEPSNPRTIRVIGRTRSGATFAAHFAPSSHEADPATHRFPKNRSACAGSFSMISAASASIASRSTWVLPA